MRLAALLPIATLVTAMSSLAASTVPWADKPLALIPTPQHATNKTDIFTTGATHMCLLHNAIFRGYNSIAQQATHLEDGQDKADFIGYCLTWYKLVKSHHDDEEANLFPQVAALLHDDDGSVWAATLAEHEAFLAGLAAFHDYLAGLVSPIDLDGEHVLELMAAFEQSFADHFRNEIGTIAALAEHPSAPAPGSPEEAAAAAMFKAWGKATVSKAGMMDCVPFFLLNHDRSTGFENGRWAAWPPMPAPIRWGLVNLVGAWNSGWWQFSSCGSDGQPQVLYALRQEKGKQEL